MKRKNVLLIITDQQRSSDFWGPNWAWDNLPSMQRLMRHGMNFTRAFCNTCMCSPSRSTLFTGLYPAQHGVTRTLSFGGEFSPTEPQLNPSIPNMARILFGAGYNVHYRGKWHLSKGNFKGDTKNDLTAAEVGLFGFRGWVPPDAGEDAEPENFGGGFANHDEIYVQQAIDFITAHQDDEEPWALILSLVNPHDVLAFPSRWEFGYKRKDFHRDDPIPLPGSYTEDLQTNRKPNAQNQLLKVLESTLGAIEGPHMAEDYLNFYANLQTFVDKQINQVVDLFYEPDASRPEGERPNALFENTWIIRTSDHGEMGMAHGGLRQKAFNAYEESIRIPLIWANPVHFPERTDADGIVSLVDTMPTLMSMLGLPTGNADGEGDSLFFKGVDYSDILLRIADSVQDHILFTFDDTRAGAASSRRVVVAADQIRMVRNDRWKLAVYFDQHSSFPAEFEYYDLSYVNPTYQSIECDNLAYGQPEGYPDDLYAEAMRELPGMVALLQESISEKLFMLNENPGDPSAELTPELLAFFGVMKVRNR